MTPQLAERTSGLTTQGYRSVFAIARGSSCSEQTVNEGTGTPCSRSSSRIRYLLRAADTDSTLLCGSPSAADRMAARMAVLSSTPRIA